ncbi:MAG: hypothetical protein Kow0037_03700 [Calditrichia bacterium]
MIAIVFMVNLIIPLVGNQRFDFLRTLKHELTHAIFALLSGKNVYSLSATQKRGGMVRMDDGNVLIALAPYFFPIGTWTIIFLAIILNVRDNLILIVLAGSVFGFHLWSVLRDFHPGQPDIQESGLLYSVVVTFSGNTLAFLFLILTFAESGFSIKEILSGGFQNSIDYAGLAVLQIKKVFFYATNYF